MGVEVCAAEVVAGVEDAAPNILLVGVDVVAAAPKRLLPLVCAGLAAAPKMLLPLFPPAAAWPNGLLAAGVVLEAASVVFPALPNRPLPPPDSPAFVPLMLFEDVFPKEKLGVPVEAAPKRPPEAGVDVVAVPNRPPEAGAVVEVDWPAGPLDAGVPKVNDMFATRYTYAGKTVRVVDAIRSSCCPANHLQDGRLRNGREKVTTTGEAKQTLLPCSKPVCSLCQRLPA